MTAAAWRDGYGSWSRVAAARHLALRPSSAAEAATALRDGGGSADGLSVLAYGNGRSYGDVPLNPDGRLLDARGLDRFVAFDRSTGVLSCKAGVRLADILAALWDALRHGGRRDRQRRTRQEPPPLRHVRAARAVP